MYKRISHHLVFDQKAKKYDAKTSPMYIGLGILEMNNDGMHHAYVLKPFLLVFNNIFVFS